MARDLAEVRKDVNEISLNALILKAMMVGRFTVDEEAVEALDKVLGRLREINYSLLEIEFPSDQRRAA